MCIRDSTFTFVSLAVLLFVAGALLAYFVLDKGLYVLMTMGGEVQVGGLTGQKYYDFLLGLTLVFGVSFELPLIVVMLNLVGVLRYEHVKDKRRGIIVGLFIFAAFMTPGQDPFSMLALGTSMCLLVELSFQFIRFNDKRHDRERPDWLDLEDDEASSPIGRAQPVGAAAPVHASGSARGRASNVDKPEPIAPAAPVRSYPSPRRTQTPNTSGSTSRKANPPARPAEPPQGSSYGSGGMFDDVL